MIENSNKIATEKEVFKNSFTWVEATTELAELEGDLFQNNNYIPTKCATNEKTQALKTHTKYIKNNNILTKLNDIVKIKCYLKIENSDFDIILVGDVNFTGEHTRKTNISEDLVKVNHLVREFPETLVIRLYSYIECSGQIIRIPYEEWDDFDLDSLRGVDLTYLNYLKSPKLNLEFNNTDLVDSFKSAIFCSSSDPDGFWNFLEVISCIDKIDEKGLPYYEIIFSKNLLKTFESYTLGEDLIKIKGFSFKVYTYLMGGDEFLYYLAERDPDNNFQLQGYDVENCHLIGTEFKITCKYRNNSPYKFGLNFLDFPTSYEIENPYRLLFITNFNKERAQQLFFSHVAHFGDGREYYPFHAPIAGSIDDKTGEVFISDTKYYHSVLGNNINFCTMEPMIIGEIYYLWASVRYKEAPVDMNEFYNLNYCLGAFKYDGTNNFTITTPRNGTGSLNGEP